MSVTLIDKSLWREFDAEQNEMIITKIGRNLFPILEYSFSGLNEYQNYQIGISMRPTSRNKLKFTAGRWDSLETLEEILMPNEVLMPKCKTGRELMSRGLKLEKLKLTNTKEALLKSDQMIRVQSMRQYMPTLTVYEIHGMGESRILATFQFPETKFIAVTAYQSESVKHLKVQRNKFAQGFREGSRATTKRPQSTMSSTSPSSVSTSSDTSESFEQPVLKKDKIEDITDNFPVTQGYSNFTSLDQNFENFPNFSANFNQNWAYQYNSQSFGDFQNFQNFQNLQNPETPPTSSYYDYSNLPFGGYQWN